MKSIYVKCVLAVAATAAPGAAHAQQSDAIAVNPYQSIYVRTDGLTSAVAKRVEEEAQKGLQPLRQYVQRNQVHPPARPDLAPNDARAGADGDGWRRQGSGHPRRLGVAVAPATRGRLPPPGALRSSDITFTAFYKSLI